MPLQHFLWNKPRSIPDFVTKNLECYSEPFQSILFQRGITTSEDAINFLLPKEQDWHSVIQLRQIDTACQIISDAVENQDLITVYGDYDADGATSTALVVRALNSFGATGVSYLVPNRFEYGYGLTPEIVGVASEFSPQVLITVDNGISSIDGVNAAKQNNIKVVVTDHHLPGQQLPEADAIVNPNQPGCEFSSKSIAGVGVAFYLMLAVRAALRDRDWFNGKRVEPNMADLLDLVALA